MGAGTENGKTNLGYGYTILIDVVFFSEKSDATFIMTK